jgi:hypothetical protein
VTIYRKSLLYLVSRGFERPKKNEEPLVGMQRFFDDGIRAASIVAPDPRCDARSHGGFDEDPATMNELMRRVLGGVPVQLFGSAPQPGAFAPAIANVALLPNGRIGEAGGDAVVGGVGGADGVVQSNKRDRRKEKRGKDLPRERPRRPAPKRK